MNSLNLIRWGKLDNTIDSCLYLEIFFGSSCSLEHETPSANLLCQPLKRTLPSYEFSLYTPMFLHPCILKLFGVHESIESWLNLCVMTSIVQVIPLFFDSYINHQSYNSIMPSANLTHCSKFIFKKQSFLSCSMPTDVRHIIAYLWIGLSLSTSTLYLGSRSRNI